MSSYPAYVLAGGVSHTPTFFERLIKEFDKKGVRSVAVSYPTVGENTEGTTILGEIAAIQKAALHFLDEEHMDVVLMLHSYGSWPGSRAIPGLDKESRVKKGKATGIVEVVFLSAFLIPENAPMKKFSYLPPWITVHENGTRIPNEQCIPILFNDLDEKEQKYWFSQFRPQRNAFDGETIPGAPWHLSVPKTCIICTEDCGNPIEFQLGQLKGIVDKTWSFKSIRSGHEPFLSKPKELAEVLLAPTH